MDNYVNRGNDDMIEKTKLAAFYLWEYTKHENTLALWYCTEDIASFFERCQMFTEESMWDIMRLSCSDREYRSFIRHIAYRVHLYTGVFDNGFNWQVAEQLVDNADWRKAIIALANGMNELRGNGGTADGYRILSPTVKEYYNQSDV